MDESGESLENDFKKANEIKYLIISKNAGLIKDKGLYKMNHYVADLSTRQIIASYSTITEVDPNLSVEFSVLVEQSTGKEVSGSFESHDMFRNAIFTETRKKLSEKLKEKAGVTSLE